MNLCIFYLNGFCIILQVPFYIGELTEKVAEDDRLKVLKISRDHLKVRHNWLNAGFLELTSKHSYKASSSFAWMQFACCYW